MHCPIEIKTDYCGQAAILSCLITGSPIQGSRRWEAVTVNEVEEVTIDSATFAPADGGLDCQSHWRRMAQAAIDGNADLQARAEALLETASRDAMSFRRAG